ncbi:hypothetical protein PR003_g30242 [Phytophthora rubi]|uniref:Uncharacterized protein n=1 Tax=Phytophthora rubi TaxID=129364 RepID=A0A6A4BBM1_9STRA|nr:hypothetical protein PR003_g30242 [Phytophthora rubi]
MDTLTTPFLTMGSPERMVLHRVDCINTAVKLLA